jgi:peptidyl-prolyl cis-trans isomerase D
MLDAIRKRKENFFYTFIILITAAVMLFFGVGQNASDSSGNGPTAWVNGEMISKREYQQALQNMYMQYAQMLGNQFDEKLLRAFNLEGRALDELVRQKLVQQEATKLKVSVSDKELESYIKSLPYFQTKDGKFDYENYKKLQNPGEREKEMRTGLQRRKLETYLLDRIRLTPAQVKRGYMLKNTKVDLEVTKIELNAIAPDLKPSSTDVENFLKSGGTEIQAYYDSHQPEFTEKASVELRQIRVGVPFQASESQRSEAKKKIDAIAKEVTKDNFDAVARAKSDDEHAKKGGLVGWVGRGSLEKPLEDAIDKLSPGQVSPVVSTPYGFYVLQISGKKDAVTEPLDKVRKNIAVKVLSEKRKKDWVEEKKKHLETLLAEGKSIEGELKSLKATPKKTGMFSLAQGYIPNIGQNDAMMDSVFELSKQSPLAKKLFYHQDAYYTLKLASIELPKEEDLVKDRENIEKSLQSEIQNEVFRAWVEDLKKKASIKMEIATSGKQPPETLEN